jgi:signal transduction histidine kinase
MASEKVSNMASHPDQISSNDFDLGGPLAVMRRLQEMTAEAVGATDLQTALDSMLSATIDLHAADFGNIQLLDTERRELRIVAQRGFNAAFLETFDVVDTDDDTACGRVLRSGSIACIEDVTKDPDYEEYTDAAAQAGYRAVQSAPLICSNGDFVGVLSTHFRNPRTFSEVERLTFMLVSRQVADLISNRQQRNALMKLNEKLAESNAEMAERDRNKDMFLTTLGHELRNPLGAIRNCIELMTIRPAEDEQSRKALGVLRRQSDQLLSLLNDLLDLERVKHGKFELRLENVDIGELAKEAADTYRSKAEKCGLELRLSLPAKPQYVHGDPARLRQIFENLLDNAFRFTDEGKIEILVREKRNQVEVVVRDTGTGIDPKEAISVFEPYFQTTRGKTGAGSLGFGLALVNGIVEKHRGVIDVHSDGLGTGTAFTFAIPSAKPGESSRPDASPRPDLRRHRILVVDDDRDNANMFAAILIELGQSTEVAYDGATALEIAHVQRPAVVFLDLSMPGMSGRMVAQHLRDSFSPSEMVLVALTGLVAKESEIQQDPHFSHYLLKPAELKDVEQLLNTI